MKKIKKVVSSRNLRLKPPVSITLFAVLFSKVFNLYNSTAGAIGIGVIGSLLLLLWGTWLAHIARNEQVEVDLFEDKKPIKNEPPNNRSQIS